MIARISYSIATFKSELSSDLKTSSTMPIFIVSSLFFSASLSYMLYQLFDLGWVVGFTYFIFYTFGGDAILVIFMVGLLS